MEREETETTNQRQNVTHPKTYENKMSFTHTRTQQQQQPNQSQTHTTIPQTYHYPYTQTILLFNIINKAPLLGITWGSPARDILHVDIRAETVKACLSLASQQQ